MRCLLIGILGLTLIILWETETVANESKASADAEIRLKTEASAKSDQAARISSLIKDLEADNWETREKATDELRKIGEKALPALKEAAESNDPEVAWRAKIIIRSLEKTKRTRPERSTDELDIGKSVSIWEPQTLSSRIKIFVQEMGPGTTTKSFSFSTDASGKVTVTIKEETEDGETEEKTYTADSMEEFKQKYPEVVKKYGIGIDEPVEIEIPEIEIELEDIWEEFSKSWGRRWDELHKELEEMRKSFRRPFEERDWLDELFRPKRSRPHKTKPIITAVDDLGIKVEYIEPALRTQLELSEDNGVLVSKVETDSPGQKTGLQQHDIILEINNQPIKTIWEFRRLMKEVLDKSDAEILIIRKGEKKILNFKK